MNVHVYPSPAEANNAAADLLLGWLGQPDTVRIMVAGGNSPLDLYARVALRGLPLSHLNVFTLDEYGGVPVDESGTCANLLRRTVVDAWQIPPAQFFWISSQLEDALASVREHEARIARAGGLDVLILGLGQNGHIGFNEPGSPAESEGRLVALEPTSVEANRAWFGDRYAPEIGVTVGLKALLAARRIVVLAYGPSKRTAAQAMLHGPVGSHCPASFLRHHPCAHVFLDLAAAQTFTPMP
jgi:glucosamine-6-phosphate deaminase